MSDVLCKHCKKIKDSTFDFYWSNEERQRRCKTCMNTYNVEWQKRARVRIVEAREKYLEKLASRKVEKDVY